jgi:RNA polymerase sigma factor (sigma-70 family)
MADARLPDIIAHLRAVVADRDAPGVSDGQLLGRFAQQHDEAAFELLVWRHAKMVLGTCRRLLRDAHEAEDAFQACFLALARRAGSISRRESVGGWLHKVALRLALAARARQTRRTAHEQALASRLPERVPAAPAWEVEQREARLVLDDEIGRLPDKFRVPFVLCCLEGRSNAEVARELGCPLGTLASRLARARQRLCQGLARRGVTLSAALLAALLSEGCVSASVVASTARAATLTTASQAAAVGLISTNVASLTEGVLRAMLMTKLKVASAVLLAVTLAATGAGVLTYGVAADGPSGVPAATKDDAKIAALIEQLGSDQFAQREKATKELEKLGLAALDALRKAATSDDLERRKRATELLKKIEAQAAQAEVLRPKRLRLVYKQTPVAKAVADFKKKSGYDLTLSDPQGKLKGRSVTLDTGEVTFWQALGQFCEKANLVEETTPPRAQGPFPGGMRGMRGMGPGRGGPGGMAGPAPRPAAAPPAGGPGGGRGAGGAAPGGPGGAAAGGPPGAAMPGAPGGGPGGMGGPGGGFGGFGVRPGVPSAANSRQIVLVDGKPKSLPTDATTSVRFRTLEKADVVGKPGAGEVLLALEVALEPRLRWQQLVAVNVHKATDDQGQSLKQSARPARARMAGGGDFGPGAGLPGPGAPGAGAPAGPAPPLGGAVAAFAGPVTLDMNSPSRLAAVRLDKGVKAATSLKELSGTVTARVLGEARALLTVANVLKAAGKTVKGTEGGSIHVLNVTSQQDGRYGLRLKADLPGATAAASTGGDRFILGARGTAGIGQYELTLVDGAGNPFPPAGLQMSAGARGIELFLSYRSRPGQGEPVKLVLGERKSVSVELPFTLRNVPLP